MTDNIQTEAGRLVAGGCIVVILHGITPKGHCTCGNRDCPKPGKHPRTTHGLKDGTRDAATVSRLFQRYRNSNVGILTGADAGLIVVDLDGPEGVESFRELQREHGTIPETRWALTGHGLHAHFRHPGGDMPNTCRRLGPGIDTRGDGGYVLVPPSRHVSGNVYAWLNRTEAAPLPGWLLGLLRPPAATRRPAPPVRVHGDRYAAAAVANECAAMAQAVEGTRNHTLNRAAFSLGSLIGAGRLEESVVRLSLLSAAISSGLSEVEAERTIESGLRAGVQHPRQVVA